MSTPTSETQFFTVPLSVNKQLSQWHTLYKATQRQRSDIKLQQAQMKITLSERIVHDPVLDVDVTTSRERLKGELLQLNDTNITMMVRTNAFGNPIDKPYQRTIDIEDIRDVSNVDGELLDKALRLLMAPEKAEPSCTML